MPASTDLDLALADNAGTVLVAGNRAFGSQAGEFGERCLAVAGRAGCSLLEFRFSRLRRKMVLCSIDPLSTNSEPWALDAIASLLVLMSRRGREL
jgi:hypothetical protein